MTARQPATRNTLFLILIIIAAVAALGVRSWAKTDTAPAAETVMEIGTAEDLKAFRDKVNAGSADLKAKLTADIDLGGSQTNQWTPIGSDGKLPFSGTFDGQGYTVKGLYISSDIEFGGLFGWISGDKAEVRNLTVSGDVRASEAAGGIVGVNQGGTITGCTSQCENVSASASTNATTGSAGGIVGANVGPITNCLSQCENVRANASASATTGYAGGIAGWSQGPITACTSQCQNVSAIAKSGYVGGIVGFNETSTVIGCTSQCENVSTSVSASVSASETSGYAGGIVGKNDQGTVTSCTAHKGTVSGGTRAGGIAGWNNGGAVTSCTSQCEKVSASAASGFAGGIVGLNSNGTVSNCISKCEKVSAASGSAGGIVGLNQDVIGGTNQDATITSCTAQCENVQAHYAGGIVGTNQDGKVTNSASECGKVSGDAAGGIVGYIVESQSNTLTNCGWLKDDNYGLSVDKAIGNNGGTVTSSDIVSYDQTQSAGVVVTVLPEPTALSVAAKGTKTVAIKTCPSNTAAFSDYITEFLPAISPDIATVSANERIISVTGKTPGTAQITNSMKFAPTHFVPDNDGNFGRLAAEGLSFDIALQVTPTVPVTSITVSGGSSVAIGGTTTLTAAVMPEDATIKAVSWSSGNTAAATVDAATGVVTGISEGSAIITATATDGSGVTGTLEVTVSKNGGSSGGCSSGLGAFALLALIPFYKKKR